LKCEIHLTLRLIDEFTERAYRICIPKPDGGVRPLTVAHDDNCFLNANIQKSFQRSMREKKIINENIFSFQKGKSCADATIIDCIIRELALASGNRYVACLEEDLEKMFDRIPCELQALLLKNVGASKGYIEFQMSSMNNRTNLLITDIFQEIIPYKCGLPQGMGFSVEMANLFSHLFLEYWDEDSNLKVILNGMGRQKSIQSIGYVDDINKFVGMERINDTTTLMNTIQKIYDRAGDFSLVFKTGRNPSKCRIYIYNLKETDIVEDLKSTAWSYENRGILQGKITPIIIRQNDEGKLMKFGLEQTRTSEEKKALEPNSYLGVTKNGFQDNDEKVIKLTNAAKIRALKVWKCSEGPQEIRCGHNMLVNSVAIYSPICNRIPTQKAIEVDRFLLSLYANKMGYTKSDAKHPIFITLDKGGHGVKSFLMEYMMALMREIEIYMNDPKVGIALEASLVQMKKETIIKMIEGGEIPPITDLSKQAEMFDVRKIDYRDTEGRMEHVNTIREVSRITADYGFMLRDMKCELLTRIIEEIIMDNSLVKALGYDKIPGGKNKPGWISPVNSRVIEKHGIGETNEILIGEAIRFMKINVM